MILFLSLFRFHVRAVRALVLILGILWLQRSAHEGTGMPGLPQSHVAWQLGHSGVCGPSLLTVHQSLGIYCPTTLWLAVLASGQAAAHGQWSAVSNWVIAGCHVVLAQGAVRLLLLPYFVAVQRSTSIRSFLSWRDSHCNVLREWTTNDSTQLNMWSIAYCQAHYIARGFEWEIYSRNVRAYVRTCRSRLGMSIWGHACDVNLCSPWGRISDMCITRRRWDDVSWGWRTGRTARLALHNDVGTMFLGNGGRGGQRDWPFTMYIFVEPSLWKSPEHSRRLTTENKKQKSQPAVEANRVTEEQDRVESEVESTYWRFFITQVFRLTLHVTVLLYRSLDYIYIHKHILTVS